MAENGGSFDLERIYRLFEERNDLLYRFYVKYDSYIKKNRKYALEINVSMIEVHILTLIQDKPGITVSEIAEVWGRTRGAASQHVSNLEKNGLIYREKDQNNQKIYHLYATEKGSRVSVEHKLFDVNAYLQLQKILLASCTEEELDACYKVLAILTEHIQ